MTAEVFSPASRADDRFREPARYARAGMPVHLRVELDPRHVVACETGADGLHGETARAEPGQRLRLDGRARSRSTRPISGADALSTGSAPA